MGYSEENIIKDNLLIYNSRMDLLDFIMDNLVSKQKTDNLKIAVADNTLNTYERYNENPYMLLSIIKDNSKTLGLLSWLEMEIKFRGECFNKLKVDTLKHYNEVSKEKIPMLIVLFNDIMDFIRYYKREVPNIENFLDTTVYTNNDWKEFRDSVSNVCIYGEKYGIQIIVSTKYDLKYVDLEDLNSFFHSIDYEEFKIKVQEANLSDNSINHKD